MFDFTNIDRLKYGPFPIGKKNYVLYEADGEATSKFRSTAAAMASYTGVGDRLSVSRIHGAGDLEPMLISMCLFEVYTAGEETKERQVTLSFVKSLPPRVTGPLFDKIKEMTPNLDGAPKADEESLLVQRARIDKQLAKLRGEDADPNSTDSAEPTLNGSASLAL